MIYDNNTQARRDEERRFYRQQLDQLTNAANLGSSWGQGGAADHAASATAGGLPRSYPRRGLEVPYGQTANEKQLDQYIAQQKGVNRGLMPGSTVMPKRNTQLQRAAGLQSKKSAETDLQKFFKAAETKIEEANDADKKRRDQILGDLEARYNRVMDRIQNFGGAARADLEERAQESIGSIHANLSARGLGNSTILAAFQQRNARDLAREQQRLSETVDTRAMNADMQMTADKAGFMERINENAPNYGQLMELAARYGVGGDGRGFNGGGQAPNGGGMLTVNDMRGGQQQQGLPAGAVAAGRNRGPMFLNGFNPMGILNNMSGMGAGPGYTYDPTVPGTSRAKWDAREPKKTPDSIANNESAPAVDTTSPPRDSMQGGYNEGEAARDAYRQKYGNTPAEGWWTNAETPQLPTGPFDANYPYPAGPVQQFPAQEPYKPMYKAGETDVQNYVAPHVSQTQASISAPGQQGMPAYGPMQQGPFTQQATDIVNGWSQTPPVTLPVQYRGPREATGFTWRR